MAHERNQIIMFQCVSWFDLFEYLKKFVKVVVDMKVLLIVTWDEVYNYFEKILSEMMNKLAEDLENEESMVWNWQIS